MSLLTHACEGQYNHYMASNLKIDDKLLNEALKISGLGTKRAAVTQALKEFIRLRKQQKVVELFGTIDFDESYNYKRQRTRV